MAGEFKVGQTVKRVRGGENDGLNVGDEAKIVEITPTGYIRLDRGIKNNSHDRFNLEIVKDATTMSNIIDKVRLLRMSEPDKSLVQAGLMNLDSSLTKEGQEAMNDLLIQEYKEKLKTRYALPILAEQKEKKD